MMFSLVPVGNGVFVSFFFFHLIIGGPISLDGIIPLFFALDLSISLTA